MLKNSSLIKLFLILPILNSIFSVNTENIFPQSIEVEVKCIKNKEVVKKLILSSYSGRNIIFAPQEFENKFFRIFLNNISSDKPNLKINIFSKLSRTLLNRRDARTSQLGEEIFRFEEPIDLDKEYSCNLSSEENGSYDINFGLKIKVNKK